MVMEAFERELNVMRFLLPRSPALLEVGPGSGILSTYLKLLLKRSTPLTCAPCASDASAVCQGCGNLASFNPLSMAADLNPTAAQFSHMTLSRHEPSTPYAAAAAVADAAAVGPAAVLGPSLPASAISEGSSCSAASPSSSSEHTERAVWLSAASSAVHVGPETQVRAPHDVRVSDLLASFPPPPYPATSEALSTDPVAPAAPASVASATMPPVDVLVFNPPYVPSSAAEAVHPDVYVRSYAGGLRGRAVLDRLVPLLRSYLARHGHTTAAAHSHASSAAHSHVPGAAHHGHSTPVFVETLPAQSSWRRCSSLLPPLSSLFYLVVMLPYNDIPSLLPFVHAHTAGLAAHVAVARQEGIETLAVLRFADPRTLRAKLPRELIASTTAAKTAKGGGAAAAAAVSAAAMGPQRLGLRFPVLVRACAASATVSSAASSTAATAAPTAASATGAASAADAATAAGTATVTYATAPPPLMSDCMHWGLTCSGYKAALARAAAAAAAAAAMTSAAAAAVTPAAFVAESSAWCACPCALCDPPLPSSAAAAATPAAATPAAATPAAASGQTQTQAQAQAQAQRQAEAQRHASPHRMPPGWALEGVFVAFTNDGAAADYALLPEHGGSDCGMVRVSLDGTCSVLARWTGSVCQDDLLPAGPPATAVTAPEKRQTVGGSGVTVGSSGVTADDGDKTSSPYGNNSGAAGQAALVLRAQTAHAAHTAGGKAAKPARPAGEAAYIVRMTPRDEPPAVGAQFRASFRYRSGGAVAGAAAGAVTGAREEAEAEAAEKTELEAPVRGVCKCRWVHPGEDAEAKAEAEKHAEEEIISPEPEPEPEVAPASASAAAEESSSDDSDDDAGAGFSLMFM